jgi:transposase InsO family protein
LETLDGNHAATEVRQAVFLYREAYYHRLRLHSALDYLAPAMFNSGRVAYWCLSNGVKSKSVFMYIEAYYNRVRIHSALDYVSPDVFNSGNVA